MKKILMVLVLCLVATLSIGSVLACGGVEEGNYPEGVACSGNCEMHTQAGNTNTDDTSNTNLAAVGGIAGVTAVGAGATAWYKKRKNK